MENRVDEQAPAKANLLHLKAFIQNLDPRFPQALCEQTRQATQLGHVLSLHNLRKRALSVGLGVETLVSLRLALVGGPTLRPLADLVEHFVSVLGNVQADLMIGEFDSYNSEISDPYSGLYRFKPDVIFVLPSTSRCHYNGPLLDPIVEQKRQAKEVAQELLELCRTAHEQSSAPVILCNFTLPPYFDPGPLRSSSLVSDYGFRKYVNMHIGLHRPEAVHICDAEFLANRLGTLRSVDERSWFESKQPFSADMMVQVAREIAEIITSLKRPAKKVLVLDLDNTLWGGVIGDDGIEGIEIGTTSPRGEAFRQFQQHILSLSQRGILLAVCSKNAHDIATAPFTKHPEMVLQLKDIVSFKANWEPKSDNVRQIATELNVGLDSLVFVDDNPAEIEIVRQFVPEVTGVCLGDDPSLFVGILKDSRLFEISSLTREDVERVGLYKQDMERQQLRGQATDMESYLKSLDMVGHISKFAAVDAPRISQLINKSNQFNLTTARRTESEVLDVMRSAQHEAFTLRLTDRFGDHGLILVVIGKVVEDEDFLIDTWLMSCRVLKRGVEQETMNAILRRARARGCRRIIGKYLPTKKNEMVRELYPSLGFSPIKTSPGLYVLENIKQSAFGSHIRVVEENE